MKKKEKTPNAWLDAIMSSNFTAGTIDSVPEGWLTLTEMSLHAKLSQTTMRSRVQRLLRDNIIQKKKFNINTGRHICSVWHYSKS